MEPSVEPGANRPGVPADGGRRLTPSPCAPARPRSRPKPPGSQESPGTVTFVLSHLTWLLNDVTGSRRVPKKLHDQDLLLALTVRR